MQYTFNYLKSGNISLNHYEFRFGDKTNEERAEQKEKDIIQYLGNHPELVRRRDYVAI